MSVLPAAHDPTPCIASALAGALCVLCLAAAVERLERRDEPAPRRVDPDTDLRRWSARELRTLPGIGEKRAVEIVRARWAGRISGEIESLDRVPGIGPGTVERIRRELAPRGRPSAPGRASSGTAGAGPEEETRP